MSLKRPNKKLESQIIDAVKDMICPIHRKSALVSMDDEREPVKVEACCPFFKNDVFVVGERLRKDFLYREEKTRERLERERKKRDRQ
jgi:hypothetical protein